MLLDFSARRRFQGVQFFHRHRQSSGSRGVWQFIVHHRLCGHAEKPAQSSAAGVPDLATKPRVLIEKVVSHLVKLKAATPRVQKTLLGPLPVETSESFLPNSQSIDRSCMAGASPASFCRFRQACNPLPLLAFYRGAPGRMLAIGSWNNFCKKCSALACEIRDPLSESESINGDAIRQCTIERMEPTVRARF
jgi:hypothetical protein